MRVHFCVDIRALLSARNLNLLLIDAGTEMFHTDSEAREFLRERLDEGIYVLPAYQCKLDFLSMANDYRIGLHRE